MLSHFSRTLASQKVDVFEGTKERSGTKDTILEVNVEEKPVMSLVMDSGLGGYLKRSIRRPVIVRRRNASKSQWVLGKRL